MRIDFHTHIFAPEIKNKREKYIANDSFFASLYSNPKAKIATVEEVIESMDQASIDKSVVLNIDWGNIENFRINNDYILESITRYPGRLIGFCTFPLESPDVAIKELERCSKQGIKGAGEFRPSRNLLGNPAILDPIANYLIEHDLVFLTHTSEPLGHIYAGKGDITPDSILGLIKKFPDLKIVCAHWGGGLPFYALMPEVKKALTRVYFDTAASPFLYTPQVYTQVGELVGYEKILFGTDYPLLTPERITREIDALALSETEKKQILGRNAARLLGIV